MKYLLDTNILLGYFKKAPYAQYIEEKYDISNPRNISAISIVTYAELFSIAIKRHWGEDRKQTLNKILLNFPITLINRKELAHKFAEIDSFCENKHPLNPAGFSAIKLSDNDIWIAATASLSKSILVTTDKDFIPLNKVFIDVIFVDQKIGYS